MEIPTGQSTTVQIVITMNLATGRCTATGPLEDKPLCYGMLEMARDIVRDFDAKKQASAIVVANGILKG